MTGIDGTLPPALRAYLSVPGLAPVWSAARGRLERNGLQPIGGITADLDHSAAEQLSGLLGETVTPGAGRRIRLADLDKALRRSSGGRGLVSVLETLDGRTVVDRRAARDRDHADWAEVWQRLDHALHEAGLAGAPWVPGWITALKRGGMLTRAGSVAAGQALDRAVAGLALLLGTAAGTEHTWELAALASRVTGTAHGFDETTLASSLLLRAAAQALDRPIPESAADRRELWGALGVATDMLSGTVLCWQVRPPGRDSWSAMMRDRADLGLMTHLTLHELAVAGSASWLPTGQVVSVCENPQVMQAAVRASTAAPLLCLSGNPASAGTQLLRRLIAAGNPVRYHGDFDWPGVAIAGRVLEQGAIPWRMSADDYTSAVAELDAAHAVALAGRPVPTPWDPGLATAMSAHGLAIHEEFVLFDLLGDLEVQ
ncbi:TIGR02679 family protein [Actinoplanes siamensis]|uniref:TIGR02679 family protein n=1 Tax=Actinoplanes siamensis TaxID=1223317 RepID=A0A919N571_9ACTN|nr:TIGR02679 family protein [Actinoplanes siamensis]GIF04601.1 hypothetical protein Asi03nite_21390 [Actinoplanes siamensis]